MHKAFTDDVEPIRKPDAWQQARACLHDMCNRLSHLTSHRLIEAQRVDPKVKLVPTSDV